MTGLLYPSGPWRDISDRNPHITRSRVFVNRVENRAQSVVSVTHQLIDADAPLAAAVVDLPGEPMKPSSSYQIVRQLPSYLGSAAAPEYNPIGIEYQF